MKYLIKYIAYIIFMVFVLPSVAAEDMFVEEETVEPMVADPHCTNGDCEPFTIACMNLGRVPMCLNGDDGGVSVCVGAAAFKNLMEHHPDADFGTCPAQYPE